MRRGMAGALVAPLVTQAVGRTVSTGRNWAQWRAANTQDAQKQHTQAPLGRARGCRQLLSSLSRVDNAANKVRAEDGGIVHQGEQHDYDEGVCAEKQHAWQRRLAAAMASASANCTPTAPLDRSLGLHPALPRSTPRSARGAQELTDNDRLGLVQHGNAGDDRVLRVGDRGALARAGAGLGVRLHHGHRLRVEQQELGAAPRG